MYTVHFVNKVNALEMVLHILVKICDLTKKVITLQEIAN